MFKIFSMPPHRNKNVHMNVDVCLDELVTEKYIAQSCVLNNFAASFVSFLSQIICLVAVTGLIFSIIFVR